MGKLFCIDHVRNSPDGGTPRWKKDTARLAAMAFDGGAAAHPGRGQVFLADFQIIVYCILSACRVVRSGLQFSHP